MSKYKLVDVGRNKICREVEAANESALLREIKKHLASRGVDIEWDETESMGIICAGFHQVGLVYDLSKVS